MKKRLFLLSFILIVALKAIAQANLPDVFEIKTDTTFFQYLNGSQWQILEDKEGRWTIEQVSKSYLNIYLLAISSAPLQLCGTPSLR